MTISPRIIPSSQLPGRSGPETGAPPPVMTDAAPPFTDTAPAGRGQSLRPTPARLPAADPGAAPARPAPGGQAPPARTDLRTHQVQNQPLSRVPQGLWTADPALREALATSRRRALRATGGGMAADAGAPEEADPMQAAVAAYAARLEGAEMAAAAQAANRVLPELRAYDAGGRRLDEVSYHPAYHDFMRLGIGGGYAALPWEGVAGGHSAHAAMVYLHSQVEPGTCCPLTMTYAAFAMAALPADWRAGVQRRRYDPAPIPAQDKLAAGGGLTLGMALTEKQGGSDLRQNTTRAELTQDGWRLTGHKWFCSAPMADGMLTLARCGAGLSCFLVPRWLEGARNGIRIQRLKDKLGNRSSASAEIEYEGALALPVGEPGDGIRTILPMVHHIRLDTAMAPAGLMRAALAEALHWCRGRRVFERRLVDQPLMRVVLADLALDWEASMALGFAAARAFDQADPCARAFARVGVAIAKFHNTKLCAPVVAEAMEVLGGMGYVDERPMAMLYREAPLNAIWEGSGNVICLDALRTLARDPLAGQALHHVLNGARGADRRYDAALREHEANWPQLPEEGAARWYVERLGVLLAGAILMRDAPSAVSEAYLATRVLGERGRMAGSIGAVDTAAILSRIGEA